MNIKKAISDIQSNKEKTRNIAFKFLLTISEEHPHKIYPYWDIFVDILRMQEVSNKYVSIPLIANLISADKENRFDKLFDEFYKLLEHESPVVSPHIARVSGKIIKARPELQNKILDMLLTTDQTTKCRHKDLLKGYVIEGLDEGYEIIIQKKKVVEFVKRQLDSESPKTRKRAKEFLNKRSSQIK
jgi:hypothetical protein